MLALGAKGLVNAQFIVRDDGVYLIEVNPRASRTVPFLSKVTGVPMVELAVRIALGETLAELGWPDGLLAAAAVRRGQGAGVLDREAARRRPVGRAGHAIDRRGHRDPHRPARRPREGPARRRARAAAGRRRGSPGAALDRGPRQGDARTSRRGAGGGRVPAGGHAGDARGARARPATKRGRSPSSARQADETIGEVAILDLIATGEVRLVVNTPTPRSGAVRDAAEIRLAATSEGILCLTAMETAVAAAEALDPTIAERLSEVRSLGDWVPARAGRGQLIRVVSSTLIIRA